MASGATLLAPGANTPSDFNKPALGIDGLALNAGVTLNAGVWNYFISGGTPTDTFIHAGGQIYLDAGAVIDAAGSTDINAPMSENIVAVQLLGAEFADSPLQRLGVLRGQTINVDIRQTGIYNGVGWVGTPVANASGYAGLMGGAK